MSEQDARRTRTEAAVAASTAAIAVSETDITTLEGQRVRKASLVVPFGDLSDSDGAQTFPFAAALPANAFILAVGLNVTVGFTDGSSGVFTADLGDGVDIDAFLDGADLADIASVPIPQGAQPTGRVGAITPALTILADVNVDTATAGSVVAEILYIDGDNLD